MSIPLPPLATTEDRFLDGRLRLLQPKAGHRAGLDAVVLAAAVEVSGPAKVLDAGAGLGIVGLAIAARVPGVSVTGIEIEPELAGLANENALRNGLADWVHVVCADLTAPHADLEAKGLARESFDIIVSNPPYLEAGTSRASPFPLQARASTMPAEGLDRWARSFATFARADASLYVIHRADQLKAIFDALDGRFGGLQVWPLHPRVGDAAHRLIVRGVKGSRAPMQLLPGLVLHRSDGTFAPEVERVMRGPEALVWPS